MMFTGAWLLTWLAGSLVWVAMVGVPRRAYQWSSALGYGFMFGCLLAAGLIGTLAKSQSAGALPFVSLGLAAVIVGLTPLIVGRWRKRAALTQDTSLALPGWQRLVWWLLLLALLLRGGLLADEILLRPMFPWDAWAAWAVKSKVWYLSGQQLAFSALQSWPGADGSARALSTHAYPPFVPLLQLWSANAAGAWRESLVALPWLGAAGALLLASYGQLRDLGLQPLAAMLAIFAIGTLPLLETHVALAGYADIWVAAVLTLGVLAGLKGFRDKQRGQIAAALLLVACLPLVKLDGAVWLFWLILTALWVALPRTWRWPFLIGLLAVAAVGMALGSLILPLPGLGWVRIAWGEITVPGLGVLTLSWRPVSAQMIESLWLMPNWHLLFYLLPLAPMLGWRALRGSSSAAALGVFLLAAFAFLFGLFFFTDAAAWAENYTSVNRLILHVAPLSVALIAMLLAPGRERSWMVAGRPVRQWDWAEA